MRGLYAIIDVTVIERKGLDVVEVARAVALARPSALQLRAKDISPRETLSLLRAIVPICRENGVPLFANDRPDLAMLASCDGVHVGQTDLPVAAVRRLSPHLRVGVSTHNFDQLSAALADRPDYIAFGPVFSTSSKINPDPVVGLAALAKAARQSPVPIVAIGGIGLAQAREIGRVAAAAAVISALFPDGTSSGALAAITERARALARELLAEGEQPRST